MTEDQHRERIIGWAFVVVVVVIAFCFCITVVRATAWLMHGPLAL